MTMWELNSLSRPHMLPSDHMKDHEGCRGAAKSTRGQYSELIAVSLTLDIASQG